MANDEAELWEWVEDDPGADAVSVSARSVVAVMVAHNGAEWLPGSLAALAQLEQRPGRLIAVNAGSTDQTGEVLAKAQADGLVDAVVTGRAEDGFGVNVQIGLTAEAPRSAEWLWLLHDDLLPAPDSLSQMLSAAEGSAPPTRAAGGRQDDDAGPQIFTPKLLNPKRRNHPDQIGALGETIARTGHALPGTDVGDIDQLQVDPQRVLGASTAGMLISMAAWQRLGGLEPLVPLFRDGVEFGWRANELGITMQTVPDASMRHLSVGRLGRRQSVLVDEPEIVDWAAGLSTVVLHSAKPKGAMRRLGMESWGRSFSLLLGKSPTRAAQTLRAWRRVRGQGRELTAAAQRNAAAATTAVPKELLPGFGSGLVRGVDRAAGSTVDRMRDFTEADHSSALIDELTGNDFAGREQKSRWTSPGILGALLMLLLSVVASRKMLAADPLVGPQLLPAPADLNQAWQLWTMHTAGMPGGNPPWLGFMALGSTLSLGRPDWFVSILLLGSVALASWSAHHFAWRLVGRNWLAAFLAALWGLCLPLVGAIGNGALDVVLIAICLPLLGSVLHGWWRSPIAGAEGLRRPAAAGLWITLMASFMPLIYPLGIAAALSVAIRRRDPRGAIIAVVIPPFLLAPWLIRVLDAPARLLTGYDPTANWAGDAPQLFSAWLGRNATTNTPLWFSIAAMVAIWALAVTSMVISASRREGGKPQALQWTLLGSALAAFTVGTVLPKFVFTIWTVPVRPDPVPWTVIALFCLFALICQSLGLAPRIEPDADDADIAAFVRRTAQRRRANIAVATLAAILGAWWLTAAVAEPLRREPSQLPSHVIAVQQSERQTQTLMVNLGEQESYALVSAKRPAWGSGERPPISVEPAMDERLRSIAQQVVQGTLSDDAGEQLRTLGVGHIWVRGATQEVSYELSLSADLSPAQVDDHTIVYTVEGSPSLFQLRRDGKEEPITISDHPPLEAGDEILLARPADPRWRLSLDGHNLPRHRAVDGRQLWHIDGPGNDLKFSQRIDWWPVLAQGAGLFVVLVLVAPVASGKTTPKRALGGSRPVGRSALTRRNQRG